MNMKIIMTSLMVVFLMLTGSAYAGERLNLNTASASQLQTLDGIGKKTAAAIVAYRKEHGKFKSIKDLKHVKGIGKKRLEKIKDKLKVSKSKHEKKKSKERKSDKDKS